MTTSLSTMDILDRLHAALVRALREDRRDAFGSPVTVAEIYQDLVPYRLIRADLGFEMNADYEHAVLRLLSGERGLAELEPAEARRELREELDSPNPNVGLFRKFAGCDVRLMPGAAAGEDGEAVESGSEPGIANDAGGEADTPAGRRAATGTASSADPDPWESLEGLADGDLAETVAAIAPDWTTVEEEAVPEGDSARAADPTPEEDLAATAGAGGRHQLPERGAGPAARAPVQSLPHEDDPALAAACAFCDEDLPPGRSVRYCPFCGSDQTRRPCPTCGEALERAWRFCINCGGEADSTAL